MIAHEETIQLLVEARGHCMSWSARPSLIDFRHGFFTRVAAALQAFPTSGLYAQATHSVSDVYSTLSEFGRVLKIIPSSRANCFTHSAESSLRDAPVSSRSPVGAASVAPFFYVDQGWLAARDI